MQKKTAKKSANKPRKTEKKTTEMTTVRDVVLLPESRKILKKIPYWSFGTVADTIECACSWTIPGDIHEYADLRDELEKGLDEFFELKPGSVKIKRLESNILSFEKGIYPDYSPDRKPRKKSSGKKPVRKKSSGRKVKKNATN